MKNEKTEYYKQKEKHMFVSCVLYCCNVCTYHPVDGVRCVFALNAGVSGEYAYPRSPPKNRLSLSFSTSSKVRLLPQLYTVSGRITALLLPPKAVKDMFSRERESDCDRSEVVHEVVSESTMLSLSLSVMRERQEEGVGEGEGDGDGEEEECGLEKA